MTVATGVVGTAIAQTLSRYQLRCALLDAASDVGARTSKGNTAIWHTGFDATPGSLAPGDENDLRARDDKYCKVDVRVR